jgi:hypothetical protein
VSVIQQLEDALAPLRELGADDPNLKQASEAMQKQKDEALNRLCKELKITRQRLDEIIAEGKKAGW